MMNESDRKPRDKRWDEVDTTSEDPILPASGDRLQSIILSTQRQDGTSTGKICEERQEINQIVDEVPGVRREGDEVIVPVVREKMVLVKKLVLTEEIHLRPAREGEDC